MPGWVIATFVCTVVSIAGLPIAAWVGWRMGAPTEEKRNPR